MRRGIAAILFSLVGALTFHVSFSRAEGPTRIPDNTSITQPTVWKKSNSPYIVEGTVTIRAELTIEPGTVIKLAYHKGNMQLWSKINAVGTPEERIFFTSERDDAHGGDTNGDGDATVAAKGDWMFLNYGSTLSAGEMKYISILYAGYNPSGYPGTALVINNQDDVSLTKSEIMYTKGTGLMIVCNHPIVEENVIAHNWYGVYSPCVSSVPVIRRNSIFDNQYYGVYVYVRPDVDSPPPGRIDARDNWWGSSSGPKYFSRWGWPDNRNGTGDRIPDGVIFDPWLGEDPNAEPPPDPGPDPTIIIPGIMGSWEKDGVWQIDPIFHTYDNLFSAFIAAGYAPEQDLFTFPYEWRDSNVENAKKLQEKIAGIKSLTGRKKVDIVAHSMGGLLSREYIESDYFANDVDQLITLGTPHLGAPKDYIKWEAGAFFADIFEQAGKWFFKQEAEENGYDSIFHYIRGRPMESVRELLPVYDYLWDDNGTGYDLRASYPEKYPRNEFLENLNSVERLERLKKVELSNIVGKQDRPTTTISGYNVINAEMGELWKHGYPHGFEVPWIGDQGLQKSDGDGTVPIYSADNSLLPTGNKKYLQVRHNILPSFAQKDILEILTGTRPTEEVRNWVIDDILIGLVFSPVDVQIIDPEGKRLGKNFETGEELNEIEGAFYSGHDARAEFFTIPNPKEGEYEVVSQGTGEGGEYKIEMFKLREDENDPENAEILNATLEGIAKSGETQEVNVDVSEGAMEFDAGSLLALVRKMLENYFQDKADLSSEEEIGYYTDRLNRIESLLDDLENGRGGKKSAEKTQKEFQLHIDHLIRHVRKNVSFTIDETTAEAVIHCLEQTKKP